MTQRDLTELLREVGDEELLRIALASLEVSTALVEESLGPAPSEVLMVLRSSLTLLSARDERALASVRRSMRPLGEGLRPLGEGLRDDRHQDAMAVLELLAFSIAGFITGTHGRESLALVAAYERGYVELLANRCDARTSSERFALAQREYDRRLFRALDDQPGW